MVEELHIARSFTDSDTGIGKVQKYCPIDYHVLSFGIDGLNARSR